MIKAAVFALMVFSASGHVAAQWQPWGSSPKHEGVDVSQPSSLRRLVPAQQLESASAQRYAALKRDASAKRALAPPDAPESLRLRKIADRIIAHTSRFNPNAGKWQWEVILVSSRQINAFCMPGGKIAFYSGILDTLKLSDDEVAIVMGHEVAHALWEHARERVAKGMLARFGAAIFAGGRYGDLAHMGEQLATLKFSRDDETEADLVGLELAARAGFDPRAGVTLWQKMSATNRNAPPPWLSTHPSGTDRIKRIQSQLPNVMPLYERARTKP
jgi:predicted Zn-dependent protease